MEWGLLVIVVVSAGAGFFCRSITSPGIGRILLSLGLGALATAFAIIGLTVAGHEPWARAVGAVLAVVFFVVAAMLLPFALVVCFPHPLCKHVPSRDRRLED